jgi:hypothetical protein
LGLAGLQELVLEDMYCDSADLAPLPSIHKLRIVNSIFTAPLAPALFPNLEALVLLYQREADGPCAALTQVPSLRALVVSADVPLDLAACPLEAQHVLCDFVAFRSVAVMLDEWPDGRPLVHLRCAARDHAAELIERIDEQDAVLKALKTVSVVLEDPESPLDCGDLHDLQHTGREVGVAVVREAEVADGEFGFDWFVQKHGKPRAVEG